MKPIVIIAPRFLKAISLVIDVVAITLFPFIIAREEMSEDVLNHESIHIAQQKELLVVFFYLLYGWDYLKGLIKFRDKELAYYRIRFEQEAYAQMLNKNYLKNRRSYSWHKYKV
tara:strand:+ start:7740 stop:8081 length:342 start_codon:yes stop_codon:yes gene_type:complete